MAIIKEKVTWIHHWSKKMFSFKTTRTPGLRFNSGEFALMGILIDDKPKYNVSFKEDTSCHHIFLGNNKVHHKNIDGTIEVDL